MFERIAPSEADKDAEAAEGRSPDQIASLRLAAILLAINALLELAASLILRTAPIPIIRIAIALGCAYYLHKLRPRAEALAMGLAILAAVVSPILLLMSFPMLTALVGSLPIWGITGAVLLLMTGTQSRARRIAAVVLFCVLDLGLILLGLWQAKG